MSAMTASERRQQIARLLSASQAPISATTLSQELGVSRQIIVGDIALLRAAGQEITATARGYVIPAQNGLLRRIACTHSAEETRDELDAMVDCGCTVVDVIVEHPVYGQLTAPLHLSSRLDVDQFMKRMDGAAPLSQLTGGVHLHTLSCPDETAYEHLLQLLRQRGFLVECPPALKERPFPLFPAEALPPPGIFLLTNGKEPL